MAIEIAAKACAPNIQRFSCQDTMHKNCRIYIRKEITDPCWFILAPWGDENEGLYLRSGRLIIISKITGEILYNGTANDEG